VREEGRRSPEWLSESRTPGGCTGLAYIAAAQGRRGDALAILTEAGDLARASGAHRILRSAGEARAASAG
jgi:hypothetical protein